MIAEAGGHRIQRIPPTERRGRVHTSSVTVSVIDPTFKSTDIRDDDFRVEWFSGTGKGGQHRNKKQNSCRLIHVPTGLSEVRQGRYRDLNYQDAKNALINRIVSRNIKEHHANMSGVKRDQMGSGMRGDKIRTYRFQQDQVVDHNSDKRAKCSKVMRGYFDLLWQ